MVLKTRNICAVFSLLISNWSNFNKHLSSFKNLRKISHSYGRNFQILNSTKYFLKTIDKKRPRRSVVYKMVAMTGLEPVTPALWVRCSNQLSYIAENCGRIILTFTTYVKHIFQKSWKWAYKPGSVEDDHSSRRTITHTLKRPTRIRCGSHLMDSYLVLLQVEFTMPWTVASHAVRSYRTLSPLPHEWGGLLSAALVVSSRCLGVT